MVMPLAVPNCVSASCMAPASFSESSTPNTVTLPALPLPGVGGSVVVAPVAAAVVVVAPAVVVAAAAVVLGAAVVPGAAVVAAVVELPLLLSEPHAAARSTEATGSAASLSQRVLIEVPSPLVPRAAARCRCKRFHITGPRSRVLLRAAPARRPPGAPPCDEPHLAHRVAEGERWIGGVFQEQRTGRLAQARPGLGHRREVE